MTQLEISINKQLTILKDLKIDVSDLELDHYAYQASNAKDYDKMKADPEENSKFVLEALVDNRRVGMFKFLKPVEVLGYKISGYEIIEPKGGQITENRFDHIEFVLKNTLLEFIEKYKEVDWDLKSLDKDDFPKVAIRLPNGMSIKFHTKNVFEEITE